MRILAIQLNQPGDAILTTPAWRWLLQQGHEVRLMVQPVAAELLSAMPGLSGVDGISRGSFQIMRDGRRWRALRAAEIDCAIVFAKCSERPALWAWLSGARRRTGIHPSSLTLLQKYVPTINDWQQRPSWAGHVVEQHLALVGATPSAAAAARLEMTLTPEAGAWAQAWCQRRGWQRGDYLHFHLTARWPTKCWPAERVIEFLRRAPRALGRPILLTTGPAAFEVEFAQQVLAQARVDASEVGTLRPMQLAALIAHAGQFLGMDSMPMHLAAALQIPGVAVFGATNQAEWGPWCSRLRVVSPPGELTPELQHFGHGRQRTAQVTVDEVMTALGRADQAA